MIWEFGDRVGRRLVVWSIGSVVVGALLVLVGDPFWRGFGVQAIAWGAIDGAIGYAGIRGSERDRRAGRGDPEAPARAARRLRRLLLVNAALDVGYVAFGLALALAISGGDPFGSGSGWGLVVQGAFLLVFDLLHARWLPKPEPFLPPGLALFAGDEHRAFELPPGGAVADRPARHPGGDPDADPGGTPARGGDPPAALLVHGFPGTPAELRPLGEALADAGWAVRAPLLPGMGAGIGELAEMRADDWIGAVTAEAERLSAGGRPYLLVGYSFGAALSLVAATRHRPAGLVLLAPFWWPRPWWSPLSGLVRAFLPTGMRPFARLDLDAPEVRRGIGSVLAGLDLDDPDVRAGVQGARFPVATFGELFRISTLAVDAAHGLDLPILVVQGAKDEVVLPARTRELAGRFARPARVVELDAGHDLIGPHVADRAPVHEPVLGFATELAGAIAARGRPGASTGAVS